MLCEKKNPVVCFYFRMLLDNQQFKWTEFYTAFSQTQKKYVISSRLCRRNKSCPSIFPFIQFKSDKLLWSSRLIVNQAANFRISLNFLDIFIGVENDDWNPWLIYDWNEIYQLMNSWEMTFVCNNITKFTLYLFFCFKLLNFSYSK